MDRCAVVLLNYNGLHLLKKFIPLVIRYSEGCTIYVADNKSTDRSIEWLKTHHQEVIIIQNSFNAGFSKGYNLALQQVKAEYFVLLNTDVEVSPGWIHPILKFMDERAEIAACQPKILSYHEKNKFEYAGAAGGYIDILGYPFCRGRIFNTLEEDHGQYDDTRQVFWATGACFIVRASIFKEVGGFDDDFFAHMEEIDLCWRLQRAGYQIWYFGLSKVFHIGGGTLPKINPRKTYLNFRNSLTMIAKNTPASQLIWKLPLRLTMDSLAALKFFMSDSFYNFKAVMIAIKDFFGAYAKARQAIVNKSARLKIRNEDYLVYKSLIVVDYFIRKRKKFSDLKFKSPKWC